MNGGIDTPDMHVKRLKLGWFSNFIPAVKFSSWTGYAAARASQAGIRGIDQHTGYIACWFKFKNQAAFGHQSCPYNVQLLTAHIHRLIQIPGLSNFWGKAWIKA